MICSNCLKTFPNGVMECDKCGRQLTREINSKKIFLAGLIVIGGVALYYGLVPVLKNWLEPQLPVQMVNADAGPPLQKISGAEPHIGMDFATFKLRCMQNMSAVGDVHTVETQKRITTFVDIPFSNNMAASGCVGRFVFTEDGLSRIER